MTIMKRDFSQEQRNKLAGKGKAMPDGSFPIANVEDLRNAIHLAGNAKNPAAAKAHIVRRAKAMGMVSLIPVTWNISKAVMSDAEFDEIMADPDFSDTTNEISFDLTGEISKADNDKQLVFGWTSVATRANGEVVVDKQGDMLDDIDAMEAVAYDFVLNSRDGGEMHIRKGVSTLVESFVSTPEKWEAMGIPEGILPVGWWCGFHVNDQEVWKSVKSGKYKSFSVHGTGRRVAIEEAE